jgi:hypothetical protein
MLLGKVKAKAKLVEAKYTFVVQATIVTIVNYNCNMLMVQATNCWFRRKKSFIAKIPRRQKPGPI